MREEGKKRRYEERTDKADTGVFEDVLVIDRLTRLRINPTKMQDPSFRRPSKCLMWPIIHAISIQPSNVKCTRASISQYTGYPWSSAGGAIQGLENTLGLAVNDLEFGGVVASDGTTEFGLPRC